MKHTPLSYRLAALMIMIALTAAGTARAEVSQAQTDGMVQAVDGILKLPDLHKQDEIERLLQVKLNAAQPVTKTGLITEFTSQINAGPDAPLVEYTVFVQTDDKPAATVTPPEVTLTLSHFPSGVCIPRNAFDNLVILVPRASTGGVAFDLDASMNYPRDSKLSIDVGYPENAPCAQQITITQSALPINEDELKLERNMAERQKPGLVIQALTSWKELPPNGTASDQPIVARLHKVLDLRDLRASSVLKTLDPQSDGQPDGMERKGRDTVLQFDYDYRLYPQGGGAKWSMLTPDDQPVIASLKLSGFKGDACLTPADVEPLFPGSARPAEVRDDGRKFFGEPRPIVLPQGMKPLPSPPPPPENPFWDVVIDPSDTGHIGALARFSRPKGCLVALTVFQNASFSVPGSSNAWHPMANEPASAADEADLMAKLNELPKDGALANMTHVETLLGLDPDLFKVQSTLGEGVLGSFSVEGTDTFGRTITYSLSASGARHVMDDRPGGHPKEAPNNLATLRMSWLLSHCIKASDFDSWMEEDPKHPAPDWKLGISLIWQDESCVTGINMEEYAGIRAPDLVEETENYVPPVGLILKQQNGEQIYPRTINPEDKGVETEKLANALARILDTKDLVHGTKIFAPPKGASVVPTPHGYPEIVNQKEEQTAYGSIDGMQFAPKSRYVFEGHSKIAEISIGDLPAGICLTKDTIASWFATPATTLTFDKTEHLDVFADRDALPGTKLGLTVSYQPDGCADHLKIIQYESAPVDIQSMEGATFKTQFRGGGMLGGMPLSIGSNQSPRLTND